MTWTLAERRTYPFPDPSPDQKFTEGFNEVFRGDGIAIVRTPFRAPQANGVAERFVRTVRSESLDWMLILNQQHLARVLDVFVTHYNEHRPNRALSLVPPEPRQARNKIRRTRAGKIAHEKNEPKQTAVALEPRGPSVNEGLRNVQSAFLRVTTAVGELALSGHVLASDHVYRTARTSA